MRILIAEDDSSLASFVKKGLDAEHTQWTPRAMESRPAPWRVNSMMTWWCST
jgi:hypothetical protein